MLTNHQITALVLGILLPMILLLIGAYACGINKGKLLTEAAVYGKGYAAGLAEQAEHVEALHNDIGMLRESHRLDREGLMQDADRRIAFYSRRSNPLTASDLITLERVTKNLNLAQQTWLAMGASDAAQGASEVEFAVQGIRARLMSVFEAAAAQPEERAA